MLKNGLNRQNRGVLFCAATLALSVGACADGSEGEDGTNQALASGPQIVGVDRDDEPSSEGGNGGPRIIDVDREVNPSGGPSSGGPSIVGVTRDDDPSGSSDRGGPRIIDVDREVNPEGGKGPSVTREPVVPGRPAVPSTPGNRPTPPSRLDGPLYAHVTANGTGCPAGTWNAALAEDGKTFTVTFSAYSAFVSPEQKVSVKDCQLAIKLQSSENLQYAVQSFRFGGYAFLEKGLNARQVAIYYLQGTNPEDGIRAETELNGYFNRTYTLENTVRTGQEFWSPCGKERDLNVKTTIRLLNGTPAGTGYVNLAAVTGSAKVVFRVASRSCDGDKPVEPPTQPKPPTPGGGGPIITDVERETNPTPTPGNPGGPIITPGPRDQGPSSSGGPGISVERT